jgi:hypothetical protein
MVLAPTVILSALLAAFLIPTIALELDLNNPDWSWTVHDPPLNYTSIDEDFILFNRPFINVSKYPLPQRDRVYMFVRDKGWQRSFILREDETATWRDCVIFSHQSREMAQLGYTSKKVEVREDWHLSNVALEVADTITLRGTTHLTLINVTFYDYVTIRVTENASLTMINCTNNCDGSWYIITAGYWEWPSGSKGPGQYRYTTGAILFSDNATVWIEGTTLGRLRGTRTHPSTGSSLGYCSDVVIIDSWIHDVKVRCPSPIPIIDSEIQELYADEGDVETLGTTDVTCSLPFSYRNPWTNDNGKGPDLAYRSQLTGEKHEYRWGEPVNVTIRIENLGWQAFTLYFNGTDRFRFDISRYNEGASVDEKWTPIESYDPDHSRLPSQQVIEPRDVAFFTLTWPQTPAVPPGHYAISCSCVSTTLPPHIRLGELDILISSEEG